MSTSETHIKGMEATKTYTTINRSIKTIGTATMEMENGILPETFGERVQQLVTLYNGIKPLLSTIATLPLLPQAWRAAVALFNKALEAVASSPEAKPDFKAGKDLKD